MRFATWCAATDRTALPASVGILIEYTTYLAGEGKAPATIERALAKIGTAIHERPMSIGTRDRPHTLRGHLRA
jgi:hypothetical protein